MARRSRDQIIAQILEVCLQSDTFKTRIVYQANMNFNTINPYLDLLIRKGLLETSQGAYTIYKTTPKGKNTLKKLRAIKKIIPECLP
jgi:predicted transcriptional regulator